MTVNIKSPQELYDEYYDISKVNSRFLYTADMLKNLIPNLSKKYDESELSNFEQFLDQCCPFLIKNGTTKTRLGDNYCLACLTNHDVWQFIFMQKFMLDLPESETKYVTVTNDNSSKSAYLNPEYKKLLNDAGWNVKYATYYCDNVQDVFNPHPTGQTYVQFEMTPKVHIDK